MRFFIKCSDFNLPFDERIFVAFKTKFSLVISPNTKGKVAGLSGSRIAVVVNVCAKNSNGLLADVVAVEMVNSLPSRNGLN